MSLLQEVPIHVSFANGEQLPAELVGADPYTDLALLKVIPDFRAEAFDLGDSSLCKKGEWVMAIGHSMGSGSRRQRDGRRDFLQRPHDFHGCG